MMPARALLLALIALGLGGPAYGKKAAGTGEAIKAARYLNEWRIEEARPLITKLGQKAAGSDEARYLAGELGFLDGDYAAALGKLEGLGDDAVYGNVGDLRKLTTSTLAATQGMKRVLSSGGHFAISFHPGKDEAIVELAGDVLEQAWKVVGDDLGHRPDHVVRVEILAEPADLARVSTLTEKDIETTGTIALCKYNKLMIVSPRATVFGYPWMDTLTHEYTHLVVSEASHDEVPVWLQEGLARFEQTRWRGAPTTALSAIDENLLAAALKADDLISFEAMYPSMAKLPSQEAATLAFAEVNTLVGYVHSEIGYPGLDKILVAIRGGKSARRAVADVMDHAWPEVEAGWKAYLKAAKLKPQSALAARAGAPRIRFKKGKGDEGNVGVDQVVSGKARKHARLGGILRARGRAAAAAIEYERALALAPGDPFVSGKLSRTYLDLGRYQDVIALAKPLVGGDDSDATPATTLGVAYLATGDAQAAADAFEIALRVSPFDPAVRCGLAEAYDKTARATLAEREHRACDRVRAE